MSISLKTIIAICVALLVLRQKAIDRRERLTHDVFDETRLLDYIDQKCLKAYPKDATFSLEDYVSRISKWHNRARNETVDILRKQTNTSKLSSMLASLKAGKMVEFEERFPELLGQLRKKISEIADEAIEVEKSKTTTEPEYKRRRRRYR